MAPAPVEICGDVDLLSETVKHFLLLLKSKERDMARAARTSIGSAISTETISMDDMREIFIARYRDGQRKVLEDAQAAD